MDKIFELPYTLSEIRRSNKETEYNFDLIQLEVENMKDFNIVFDLVQSGGGGLFIYEIYLERQKIGSAWSKSYKLLPQNPSQPFFSLNYSDEKSTAFFYSIRKVFKTFEEALKVSRTKLQFPYCFDEYWWDEDNCGDAWFPTFDTLQQLLNYDSKLDCEVNNE